MSTAHLLGGLTLAVALAVAGCSGSDEPGVQPEQPGSSAPAEEPSAEATLEPSAEASPTDGMGGEAMTAAGTTLAWGQEALLPVEHGGGEVVVRLTVTAVVAGSNEDLTALGLEVDPASVTPVHLRVSAELVSGEAGGLDPARLVDGLGPDGPAGALVGVAPITGCDAHAFAAGAAPGTAVQSCRTVVVGSDGAVTAARFASTGTAYDAIDGAPVEWR
ncbi:hypothetical protein [Nocardioides sp. AE5]|uniref:hypothetical protein n=1 Tax=Nocardioides sp. AE5 TaxID=2962573 RepID=UPI0028826179|nr:hypothetical protein [Nocardioides sp. AE5]MDT0201061.1 hypothetical protein [Nocardioides sp. AE5]